MTLKQPQGGSRSLQLILNQRIQSDPGSVEETKLNGPFQFLQLLIDDYCHGTFLKLVTLKGIVDLILFFVLFVQISHICLEVI